MNTNELSLENQQTHKQTTWLLIFGIFLIGSNLRAPLTSVGSLIPFIRDDLALSNTLAGSITTLPLIAFALLSPFVPKLANRLGMEWTIFISMLVLATGITVRSLADVSFLFIGTILIGIAIAFGNVLLPGYIKMKFPLKVGMMTGVYAVSMNLFGALGSGLSVPLAGIERIGWPGALAVWAAISLIAILVWIPQLRQRRKLYANVVDVKKNGNHLWKSGLAWKVTLFMGCQSFIFYTLITWLPDILQSIGYRSSAAGWMIFLMQFSVIPITFIIPIIAERLNNQIGLIIVTVCFYTIGIGGLLIGFSSIIPISMVLIGIAGGSAFSLSMMFFTLRTTDGKQAAELSGMAQSFGYLLAATGPVLIGALYDIVNSWNIPLLFLLGAIGLLLLSGIGSGRKRTVDEKLKVPNK